MTSMTRLMIAVGLVLCHGAVAEVFKCIDDRGRASYRDTSCTAGESAEPVDRRYANTVPLTFDEKDAAIISELAETSRKQQAKRIERRNRQISDFASQLQEEQARCEQLKARYNEMQIMQRRYGRTDPDARHDLIRRMREACSG